MAISNDDVVRTSVNFQLPNGVLYQNVYHHILDGIGGVSDAAVVADIKAWVENAYANLNSYASSAVVEQLSSVDQVNWDVGLSEWVITANLGTFTPGFVPTGTADVAPNQIAPFITFKTARPKTVGRKFLFNPPEVNLVAGIIQTAMLTKVVDMAADLLTNITIDVANVLIPGVPRVGVFEWWDFVSAIVTDLVGTQRRRRPGYGA